MTPWERVRAALKGAAVDRTPVSVWGHFLGEETAAQSLADAMLGFQREYDWDFMKVNPRASYHSEDWGLKLRFGAAENGGHLMVGWPVKQAVDWDKIEPLDSRKGVLAEQLEALSLIAKGLDGEVPFVMTVFTPLAVAAQLAGSDDTLSAYLEESPDAVHRALEAITGTYAAFATECLRLGASGIFLATTTWGTYDRLTDEEYDRFGRPYDLRVLEAVADAEFNVLHVCRSNNMLSALADYPVAAFNWDTQDDTNVWVMEGEKITGKAAIGGISHRQDLVDATAEEVASETLWTMDAMESTHWMLGSGCTIRPETPAANLRALRDAVGGA